MKKKLIIAAMSVCAIAGAIAEEPPEAGAVAFAVEETFPEVNFIGVEGAPSSSSLLVVNNDFPSPFTNGVAWSDGEIPRKGFTYVAGRRTMRIPYCGLRKRRRIPFMICSAG